MKALKTIFFVGLGLVFFVTVPQFVPPGGDAIKKQLGVSEKMARLIAFINYKRSPQAEVLEFNLYRTYFCREIGVSTNFLPPMEYVSLPADGRMEKFNNVDYYLYSKEANLGMLCNGMIFFGEFDKNKLNNYRTQQEVFAR